MKKTEILEKASRALDLDNVELAVLFGGAARAASSHDVDLAIKLKPGSDRLKNLSKVVLLVSKVLQIPEDRVDVVDLGRAGIDLKKEIVESGLVLLDRHEGWRDLIWEVTLNFPAYAEFTDLNNEEWLRSSDPSSINVGAVKKRLEFLKGEMRFLEEHVLKHRAKEIERSPELKRLLERGFQLGMEAILDVCRHVTSAMGWGPAYSYADYVTRMRENGVFPEGTSSRLISLIALRNIIVHRYLDIDYGELYEKTQELKETSREFEARIANLIRSRAT